MSTFSWHCNYWWCQLCVSIISIVFCKRHWKGFVLA
jgi:hypothetical protein